MSVPPTQMLSVHAPRASSVLCCGDGWSFPLQHLDGRWVGQLDRPVGTVYWLSVDGGQPLVDPDCWQITWRDGRPLCVVSGEWPKVARLGRQLASPVVYEAHVKGFGGGGFAEVEARLDYLADLGIDVLELLPVHPFDRRDNYWGYMPVVWGAVHDGYSDGRPPHEALAALVEAAHRRGIAVWLDVVVNHTGEGDDHDPLWSLAGLDRDGLYLTSLGLLNNDSGCGNTVNPSSPEIRRLVFSALERFARLGVDGFRFDLAAILARDGGALVAEIARWGAHQRIEVVAEPWDLARYLLGDEVWIDPWRQWNDHFREDMRAMLRGDVPQVPATIQRLRGSPDLLERGAAATLNYIVSHDGLTLHDLFAYDMPQFKARDMPAELRPQLVKTAMTALLMSRGAAMFVMGDEFGRTQQGHANPYNIDGPISWVDWSRLDDPAWAEVRAYVRTLLALRREHPWERIRFYGSRGEVDTSWTSHSVMWTNGELYVALNTWSEPIVVEVQEPGQWDVVAASAPFDGRSMAGRSAVVWRRRA